MKKAIVIAGICAIFLIVVNLPFHKAAIIDDPRGNLYAGSAACAGCHSQIYNSYLHTAHYIASMPATENSVHGSFAKNLNVFNVNGDQKVVMEKLEDGLFQTYYLKGKIKERNRFDIVFGGVKGESYLYWKGNELYQLPLSYFSLQHQWSTSPGYGINFLDYPQPRSIRKQCLECHVSYISNLQGGSTESSKGEQFDKSTLIYGIDCERCHGPGKKHADFQSENPEIKSAKFITSYSSLNRGQRMDMCAVCHSGKPSVMLRSAFEFMPGDTFAKYKVPEFFQRIDTANLDVHGDQFKLLQSSKCYIYSTMDCATCHNTHQNTRGNDALYTQKCVTCHNAESHKECKMKNSISAAALTTNCIGCHMPALPSKIISVRVSDSMPPIQFFVHTHHIATYPNEVTKILGFINK